MWSRLSGQPRVVQQLQRAIERGRLPHALLFSGPPGAPMGEAALVLACALNCLRGPEDRRLRAEGALASNAVGMTGCGECDACARILQGIHPDVVTLVREGAANIVPIESVRAQVIGRIGLPPHEAATRVFIVEEATAMAPPAANALLKTLEEPPARTMFVLCTTAPEQLLPTIRSRCQRVRFGSGGGVGGDDAARAERIAQLGDELAGGGGDPTLPMRVAEGKGDAALVVVAAANRLGEIAREAAATGDGARARRAVKRAQAVLAWQLPISVHNANPQLAIEAIVAELATLERA